MANPDKACKAERAYATAPRRTFWVGVACALVGAGLWGVSGACAQYLFSHYGITPMFATAVRSLVASLIFFGVLFFRRRYLLQLMWGSEARTKLAFLAFGVALFVDQFAYSMTIAHTNAGTATVLHMLVTCACAGVAYAVQLAGGAGAPESVAGMDAFGWLVLLGGLTVLGTFVSFGLYLRGVAAVGSVTGSLLGAIEPVSASVCAWVFLGTAFSGFDWAGLVLMLGMLALVTLGGKPKPLIPRPRQ